jgi:DNA invertase Pin-like site-specific DNA recombinase
MLPQEEKSRGMVFSYIRLSTELQRKGDGIRRQNDFVQRYAKEHGLEIAKDAMYEDIGVSAFKSKNATEGALASFIQRCKRGEVPPGSVLLVEAFDRLSRANPLEAQKLFHQLICDFGIRIVTLTDNREYTKDNMDLGPLLMSLTLMSQANLESKNKSSRLLAAWESKRARLDRQILTRTCPNWLRWSPLENRWEILAGRGELIARLFRETIEGAGCGLIAKRLNTEGIPAWGRSDGWRATYIKKILVNRAVLGELATFSKDSEGVRQPMGVQESYYPCVIDAHIFEKATQARMSRRGTGGRFANRVANLFSGRVFCKDCGGRMQLKGNGGNADRYLVCDRGLRGLGCHGSGFPYKGLEQSFLRKVPELDLPELLAAPDVRTHLGEIKEELARTRVELASVERAMETIRRQFSSGVPLPQFLLKTAQGIDDKRDALAHRVLELQRKVALEESRIRNPADYEQEVADLIKNLASLDPSDRLEIRRRLQQSILELVKRITCAPLGTGSSNRLVKGMEEMVRASGSQNSERIIAYMRETARQRAADVTCYYVVEFVSGKIVSFTFKKKRPLDVTMSYNSEVEADDPEAFADALFGKIAPDETSNFISNAELLALAEAVPTSAQPVNPEWVAPSAAKIMPARSKPRR